MSTPAFDPRNTLAGVTARNHLGFFARVPVTVLIVVVVAGLSAIGVVYKPLVATAVAAVIILGVVAYRLPKETCGLVVLLGLLNNVFSHYVPSAKLLDDVSILVFAVVVFATQWKRTGRLRGLSGGRWFLVFLAAGLVASLTRISVVLAAEDAYLFGKGVLFAWAIAQLDWRREDVRRVVRFGTFVALLLFVFVVLNLVFPGAWYQIFAKSGTANTRFKGIPSLIGPFIHPGVLGQIMALVTTFFVAFSLAFRKWLPPLTVAAIGAAAAVLSFRRKVLGGLVAAVAALVMLNARRRLLVSAVIVAVIVLAVFAAWSPLTALVSKTYNEYIVDVQKSARVSLYKASGDLAYHNLPLGAGFGRFGGWIAASHYSPVYFEYGLDKIPGLQPGGAYLTDTFWPAVVGEAGIVGFVAYAVFLIMLFRLALRLSRNPDPPISFMGLLGCAWSIEFFLESLASAAYSSPPGYLLFFSIAGIMTAMSRLVPETAGIEPGPLADSGGRSPLTALKNVQSTRLHRLSRTR